MSKTIENMRIKATGVGMALLCLLMLMAPVSAVQSQVVTATGTVPTAFGFTMDKTAVSFNLDQYDVWKAAAESPINVVPGGNVAFNLMGKAATSDFKFRLQADSKMLDENDMLIKNFSAGSTTQFAMAMMGRAAAGLAPGTYTGNITFTAIAV